jgi:hypothetical protein
VKIWVQMLLGKHYKRSRSNGGITQQGRVQLMALNTRKILKINDMISDESLMKKLTNLSEESNIHKIFPVKKLANLSKH